MNESHLTPTEPELEREDLELLSDKYKVLPVVKDLILKQRDKYQQLYQKYEETLMALRESEETTRNFYHKLQQKEWESQDSKYRDPNVINVVTIKLTDVLADIFFLVVFQLLSGVCAKHQLKKTYASMKLAQGMCITSLILAIMGFTDKGPDKE